jgi:uncharacterized protein RhaS with RHS repeats
VAEDPIGLAGGVNLYAYVGGDPISMVDPLGWRSSDPNALDGGFGGPLSDTPGFGAPGGSSGAATAGLGTNMSVSGTLGVLTVVQTVTVPVTGGDVGYTGAGIGAGSPISVSVVPAGGFSLGDPMGWGVRVAGNAGNGTTGWTGSCFFAAAGLACSGGWGAGTIGGSVNATIGKRYPIDNACRR